MTPSELRVVSLPMADNKNGKELNKIKSSVFGRGLTLARMTLTTGAGLASQGAKGLFANEETKNENWKNFLKGQAQFFSKELGQLKGSLMKAGQMLSMYGEHFLPPEANQFLRTLQADSPPVSWSVLEKELKKNLSAEKLAQLDIQQEPIGTASLGQVHKATIKETGEVIALKVQYPGVDKAIESDLRALKSFFNMMKFLPKGKTTDQIFEEVRDMLVQEMDYPNEVNETELYRDRLQGDSRYIVPKVYREFCGSKVIATSFEPGINPGESLIRNLSQERRNGLATNFMELYFKELFEWGVVQTDPHLGNYKIRISPTGQDQLVLLDFGATRKYPKEFLDPYHQMVRALVFHDKEALSKAAFQLKFLTENDDPALKKLFEDFCLMTVEPFTKDQDYDWGASDLPRRLTQKVFQMIQKFELRPPPREILFLDRKTGGVFIFLSVLKAKLNGRPLLLEYLEKIPKLSP